MAATFTFTDLATPTTVTATAVSGGTLAVDQYYYKVIAVFSTSTSTNTFYEGKSLASSEVTATTDSTNKTVRLTWDAVSGAGGYKVYRATTSGVYLGFLNVAILDSVVNSGGTCTWDDTGYALAGNNAFIDIAHGKITIDRTGTQADDTFGVEDLYNADVSGSWGVIDKDGETYKIKTALILAKDMTWNDELKTIIFYDGITTGALTANFGLYNSTDDYTYNGCYLFFRTWSLNTLTFSELNAYHTSFYWSNEDNPNASRTVLPYLGIYVTAGDVIDCNANEVRFFRGLSTANVLYKRTLIAGCDVALFTGTVTLEDVTCMNMSRSFQTSTNSVIRAVGYVGKKMANGDVYCLGDNWTVEFVDSEVTSEPFKYLSGTGGVGSLVSTVIPTIVDKNNDPISGASVKIYDKDDTLVVDETTDANGQISDEVTMNETTFPSGVLTVEDFNPFKFIISKTGYETYTSTRDIDAPVRDIITLRPQKKVATDDTGQVYINLDKEDVKDTLNIIKV